MCNGIVRNDARTTHRSFRNLLSVLTASLFLVFSLAMVAEAPGTQPVATAEAHGSQFRIGDAWIAAYVGTHSKHLAALRIVNLKNGRSVEIPNAFSLTFQNGSQLRASEMQMVHPLSVETLRPAPSASRYSDRLAGKQICTKLADPKTSTDIRWCGILRDGSNYFRQQITIQANKKALPIAEVHLLDLTDPGAHVEGTVKGSPIVDGTMFFGFEHPLSIGTAKGGHIVAALSRVLPLRPGQSIAYSSVVGVAPPGQMRRAFLNYIERERAHPYRPFLEYDSWYDLGEGNRIDEAGALDRIRAFGNELVKKRGVEIDSFLFDDGWDNPNSMWGFDKGLPHGFTHITQAAAQYHAGLGVWLSPWGGYDKQKEERVAFGRKAGYEIVNDGFALSGPKYYAKFEQTCLDMVRQYDANDFKFDGTGNANRVFPGSEFDSDFDAAIHLIGRIRQVKPGIFINLTTGTYPSPFWLFYADSIWRGGDDHSFTGVGSSRQRWITYRDAQTYKNIVQAGPLYPLNSLMLHGLIYGQDAKGLSSDPGGDFSDEVHSYFGSGTQIQEMYITPSLLSPENWNTLAQAAKWSRRNARTLKDTHWIGGDPVRLQVYGWAAWSPEKAIVTLRNPSDKPQTFSLDIESALQLPPDAPRNYVARDPWSADTAQKPLTLRAGHATAIRLAPFEVRTLDARPSQIR